MKVPLPFLADLDALNVCRARAVDTQCSSSSSLFLGSFASLRLSPCCTTSPLAEKVMCSPADGRRISSTLGTRRTAFFELPRFARVLRFRANGETLPRQIFQRAGADDWYGWLRCSLSALEHSVFGRLCLNSTDIK